MSLPKIDPTLTSSWKKLTELYKVEKSFQIKDLFAKENNRFKKFSVQFEDLFLDYSKNRITPQSLQVLIELSKESQLDQSIKAMFSGKLINETEERAVMHTALRNRSSQKRPEVQSVLDQMKIFCDTVRTGFWKGHSGKMIADVVNIGIGGSDLGAKMVVNALKPYHSRIKTHFVSNVDESDINGVLNNLDPSTTLFLIASKTFTTQETMTNAFTARQWFLESANVSDIDKHFVALSTNKDKVLEFGIPLENMFIFWDWVGGRFSLWSSVGLSIALSIGYDNFEELLNGANAMDEHFNNTEFRKNIPVILALLGIWYRNFCGAQTFAVLPYAEDLKYLPMYLQQLDMESNGKSVSRKGKNVRYNTGPILWGEPGTNGQHSFYQLIHQGTTLIPADFIGVAQSHYPSNDHQEKLLANFFAQTEALMNGKSQANAKKELEQQGLSREQVDKLLPHKVFSGNNPSNSILLKKLTPRSLGSLIAMYEHKIMVQGALWNIFSFDQWGVELGKQLAANILPQLQNNQLILNHDPSTNGLINLYKKMKM